MKRICDIADEGEFRLIPPEVGNYYTLPGLYPDMVLCGDDPPDSAQLLREPGDEFERRSAFDIEGQSAFSRIVGAKLYCLSADTLVEPLHEKPEGDEEEPQTCGNCQWRIFDSGVAQHYCRRTSWGLAGTRLINGISRVAPDAPACPAWVPED